MKKKFQYIIFFHSFSTKLLSLTYGISDQDNSFGRGYVLLVPKIRQEKCLWIGRRISLEYTDEVSLALSYIEKVKSFFKSTFVYYTNSYSILLWSKKFSILLIAR